MNQPTNSPPNTSLPGGGSSCPSPLSPDFSSSSLPKEPGVYWFQDNNNQLLYIGKAKTLKKRIASYRRITQLGPKTQKLVKKIKTCSYQITESELDALILEAKLIHQHQPPYNLRLKDDKSPLYITISKDLYPTIKKARRPQIIKQADEFKFTFGPYPSSTQVSRMLKLIRKTFGFCEKPGNSQNRPCFYYHINQCPGACTGEISPEEYREHVKNIVLFLRGRKHSIIRHHKSAIKKAVDKKQFETASRLKNQLEAFLYVTKNYQSKDNHPLPNLKKDANSHQLNELKRLINEYLSLPRNSKLKRIEGYDISNLGEDHATASMVVFSEGEPDKSEYRHFKIKTVTKQNDPAMIGEVISRRTKRDDWPLPQLILIDGGRTQLNAAHRASPWNIPIISLAKNPDRLIIKTSDNGYVKIPLKPNHPATKLLQRIRDEAHRFAKRYQTKLHTKQYQ